MRKNFGETFHFSTHATLGNELMGTRPMNPIPWTAAPRAAAAASNAGAVQIRKAPRTMFMLRLAEPRSEGRSLLTAANRV